MLSLSFSLSLSLSLSPSVSLSLPLSLTLVQVRVDSAAKIAELELAEKGKMKDKVDMILKHNINCFINRWVWLN